jgi:hypothetical protein
MHNPGFIGEVVGHVHPRGLKSFRKALPRGGAEQWKGSTEKLVERDISQ